MPILLQGSQILVHPEGIEPPSAGNRPTVLPLNERCVKNGAVLPLDDLARKPGRDSNPCLPLRAPREIRTLTVWVLNPLHLPVVLLGRKAAGCPPLDDPAKTCMWELVAGTGFKPAFSGLSCVVLVEGIEPSLSRILSSLRLPVASHQHVRLAPTLAVGLFRPINRILTQYKIWGNGRGSNPLALDPQSSGYPICLPPP